MVARCHLMAPAALLACDEKQAAGWRKSLRQ
jgi:hypothetical protein